MPFSSPVVPCHMQNGDQATVTTTGTPSRLMRHMSAQARRQCTTALIFMLILVQEGSHMQAAEAF